MLLYALSPYSLFPLLLTVGVNYAQTRTFATPERHLFYDAGAGSTRATIVEFSTKTITADSILSIGSTQKEAVIVDVLSAGWDRRASGLAIDVLLRDILADDFAKAHGAKLQKPVREQPRAMARLLKEANRVKHILSANAEASVNIEGLAEEVDFRSRISREQLEKAVSKAGLTNLFAEPVSQALKDAKMKMVSRREALSGVAELTLLARSPTSRPSSSLVERRAYHWCKPPFAQPAYPTR